ncbi:DeoR/GlpR family DNA-binding transcription regulator [Paracoccus xiamenensis]|uniref:DeoR/GlpR family DNA-binding transcription regulator n=1 Tax=Paracoccus xiamenensis TaxID=2714901 RepID=UPI00140811A3|nr:DeoR/GlpR family DNA-binding transcription regulator [Paracoccus xiamenensis]NHF71540.1 DeoR/GlpR transcriptional regulator [Paracoccus xiamenensis]
MLDLNCPQTRQSLISDRLDSGQPLIAASLADELGISVDTLRRDLIALEQRGLLRRVRGGAIPLTPPLPPYSVRVEAPEPALDRLAAATAPMLEGVGTVFLDGGTTMNAVAAQLPAGFGGLVVTPAPSVALAALARGARVHLIGGALCPDGAMATGGDAERAIAGIAADFCLLGACGLWPGFGLSAEDSAEAGVKRAMARAAGRVAVVAAASKLARRGRHNVLALEEIDLLVTDADAPDMAPFCAAGIEVHYV